MIPFFEALRQLLLLGPDLLKGILGLNLLRAWGRSSHSDTIMQACIPGSGCGKARGFVVIRRNVRMTTS